MGDNLVYKILKKHLVKGDLKKRWIYRYKNRSNLNSRFYGNNGISTARSYEYR